MPIVKAIVKAQVIAITVITGDAGEIPGVNCIAVTGMCSAGELRITSGQPDHRFPVNGQPE